MNNRLNGCDQNDNTSSRPVHDLENGGPITFHPVDLGAVAICWPDECGNCRHLIIELPEAKNFLAAFADAINTAEYWQLRDLEALWDA